MKNEIVIYCDGFFGSRKHPRPGCSVGIVYADGRVEKETLYADKWKCKTTNEAEYFAMYCALQQLKRLHAKYAPCKFIIYSDSMLVVEQMNLRWQISMESLLRWHTRCRFLLRDRYDLTICWIARSANVKILGH